MASKMKMDNQRSENYDLYAKLLQILPFLALLLLLCYCKVWRKVLQIRGAVTSTVTSQRL